MVLNSIVVAAGKDADLIRQDLIYQPVFLTDPPRPAPREFMLQWLRLAQARKRFPLDLANEADDPERLGAILPNPPSQVLERGGIKFQASQRQPRARVRRCAASPPADAASSFPTLA